MFGASAVETLESCAGLAPVLVWVLGQKDEAVALVRRAVEGRTALLGPAHPSTLIARTYLLEFTAGPGTHPDAGAALVSDCRSEVGPRHPITLDAELNHGFALVTADRQHLALVLIRNVVTGSEHTYGIEHPKTLAARSLLSRVLGELGRSQEASAQAELVAEARARVLGPGHPWTQWSLDRLAERRHALDDERRTGGGDEGEAP